MSDLMVPQEWGPPFEQVVLPAVVLGMAGLAGLGLDGWAGEGLWMLGE